MSIFRCITLLYILGIIESAHATKWTQCGVAGSFQVSNCSLSPATIYPGNSARFTIDAVSADHDVGDGTITMLVRVAGLPIYTQADDFCSKTECPVPAGTETKIVYEQNFPEITPPGSYSVTLSGKSGAGEQLFCVIISFDVTPPPPPTNDANAGSSSSSSSPIITSTAIYAERLGGEVEKF